MTKNLRVVFGVSALCLLGLAGVQGCSDSSDTPSPGAGEAGSSGAAGAPESAAGASPEAGAGAGGAASGGDAGAGGGSAGDNSAGAGGEGGAGELTQAELCEKFCLDEAQICTGDLSQYADLADCGAACNQFARGAVGDTSGNTLDCRIYHLNAAATVSAATHCPHTSATPTAFCVN
ncbi:MAG: hypothetical protein WDO69_10940 [Pseudomonadota bacterium]